MTSQKIALLHTSLGRKCITSHSNAVVAATKLYKLIGVVGITSMKKRSERKVSMIAWRGDHEVRCGGSLSQKSFEYIIQIITRFWDIKFAVKIYRDVTRPGALKDLTQIFMLNKELPMNVNFSWRPNSKNASPLIRVLSVVHSSNGCRRARRGA